MKIVSLFLDDERYPPTDGRNWVIVRSVPEAIDWVLDNGIPPYISFDNDLGQNLEGRHFAVWLTDRDLDTGEMPDDFQFFVHSQNPIAAQAIRETLASYLAYRTRHKTEGSVWPPPRDDISDPFQPDTP